MTIKEFLPYDLALKMKAIGFDEPCLAIHSNANPKTGLYTLNKYRLTLIKQGSQKDKGVKAPTWSAVFRWFRDEYGYWSYVKEAAKGTCRFYIQKFDVKSFTSEIYNSYEEAEIACLDKLIEIV